MKLLLTGLGIIALSTTNATAPSATFVRGHVTRHGTYVAPSYRMAPNSTRVDNWSSRPNYNPHTERAGPVDPYAPNPPKLKAFSGRERRSAARCKLGSLSRSVARLDCRG